MFAELEAQVERRGFYEHAGSPVTLIHEGGRTLIPTLGRAVVYFSRETGAVTSRNIVEIGAIEAETKRDADGKTVWSAKPGAKPEKWAGEMTRRR